MAFRERPKCRSFDSAEVRFAQDDRPFMYLNRNFADGTLELIADPGEDMGNKMVRR
jgi:hypothetical protein